MKKSELYFPEKRKEKIAEHANLDTRKNIRDKKYYVIDDDETIDEILDAELTRLGIYND